MSQPCFVKRQANRSCQPILVPPQLFSRRDRLFLCRSKPMRRNSSRWPRPVCAQRLSVDCMRGLLDHPISGLRHGGSLVQKPPLMIGDELLLQHGLNAAVFSTKAVLRRNSIYTDRVEVLRQLLLAKGVAPLPVAPNASPPASSPISTSWTSNRLRRYRYRLRQCPERCSHGHDSGSVPVRRPFSSKTR
jgi:hypothetical protein